MLIMTVVIITVITMKTTLSKVVVDEFAERRPADLRVQSRMFLYSNFRPPCSLMKPHEPVLSLL